MIKRKCKEIVLPEISLSALEILVNLPYIQHIPFPVKTSYQRIEENW